MLRGISHRSPPATPAEGAQRARDIAHDAALAVRGYHVLRFTYAQVVDDWPAVQDAVMRAIAAGLHLAR